MRFAEMTMSWHVQVSALKIMTTNNQLDYTQLLKSHVNSIPERTNL